MGHRAAPDPASPATRVKRLRDKYEAELSELEQSERKLQERCAELKGRLGEAEGENVRLQGLVRQKEKELADVKAVSRWIRHLSPGPQPPPSTHTVPVVPHVPQAPPPSPAVEKHSHLSPGPSLPRAGAQGACLPCSAESVVIGPKWAMGRVRLGTDLAEHHQGGLGEA